MHSWPLANIYTNRSNWKYHTFPEVPLGGSTTPDSETLDWRKDPDGRITELRILQLSGISGIKDMSGVPMSKNNNNNNRRGKVVTEGRTEWYLGLENNR